MAIERAICSLNVQLMIINTYFDLDEYQNPIRTYIEDGQQYSGIEGVTNNVEYYFKITKLKQKIVTYL